MESKKNHLLIIQSLALAAYLFIGYSCANTSRQVISEKANSPLQNNELRVNIEVKRLTKADEWQATYQLNKPVSRLVFLRQTNQFRASQWKVLNPTLQIILQNGQESIVAKDGSLFTKVSVQLKTYTDTLVKDYGFFKRFSDGSLLMFTGHYNVGLPASNASSPIKHIETHFTFHGLDSDRLVYLGQISTNPLATWKDDTEDGTYIYFGQIQPLKTPRLLAVVDPALPDWLRNKLLEGLPKIFDFYSEQLKVNLTFRPTIFFSYLPDIEQQVSGGSLPQVIQLGFAGSGVKKFNPAALEHVFYIFAHEAAHFWNLAMYKPEENNDWMHEGSAEAFTFRALLDFGVINLNRYLEIQAEAAYGCAQGLRNGKLVLAAQRREPRPNYDCGAIIALITEAAIRRHNQQATIFSFWAKLLSNANPKTKTYEEKSYLSLLEQMTAEGSLVKQIKALIYDQILSPTDFLVTLLQNAGIQVERSYNNLSARTRMNLGRSALQHLLRNNCQGPADIIVEKEYAGIRPLSKCQTFTQPV